MFRVKSLTAVGLALVFAMATVAFGAPAQNQQKDDSRQSALQFPAGALAPDNLAKPRPKPPFNLTGVWMVDLSSGFSSFMFGPPYPKFKPDEIGRASCRERV